MDDDMFLRTDPGDIEVERRLRAYADIRLTPGPATTSRMRANVMNAAHRRAALMTADAPVGAHGPAVAGRDATGTRPFGGRWRRPVAAALAACLTLGLLAGTVYGSRPGGPFYTARIWAEMVTLPGDAGTRADAEVARLETRLREAQEAAAAGDVAAAGAALEAYSAIVQEAAASSQGDPGAVATLEAGVTRHVAVLTGLVGQVPAQAQSAIQHALSSSTQFLDDIDTGSKPGNGAGGAGGGANGGGGAGGGANGGGANGGGAGPDGTPSPTAKDKPGKTPDIPANADETAKPAATARPTDRQGGPTSPDPSRKP